MGLAPGTPTYVYTFSDDYNGALLASRPEAAPTVGLDGAIYGVTQKSSRGGGVVFRMLNSPTAVISSITETGSDSAIARRFVNMNGESGNVVFEYSPSVNFSDLAATTAQVLSGTSL